MKMQQYIRIVLSFILILSNLNVAFSMHLCQGQIEEVKLAQIDKKVCKLDEKPSCCAVKAETDQCEDSNEKNAKDDCCEEKAYAEDLQDLLKVDVLKLSPIFFEVNLIDFNFDYNIDKNTSNRLSILDSYIESNAPPIYILFHKLMLYEA